MSYDILGNYIELVDERNIDGMITNLLGINIQKKFMPSIANVSQTDLTKYKIIKNRQFAYSPMQAGRDKCIRAVLYSEKEPSIISPAYQVFQVIDENKLMPEFLMMWLLREEADRLGWFYSDSSVRASLEWGVFCNIMIPIPKIEIQKKYVSIYNGILKNQRSYEDGMDELYELSEHVMSLIIKDGNRQLKLRDIVEQIDIRNADKKLKEPKGIDISKSFIISKAKITTENLKKYKIITPGDFGYSPMQVGRDKSIRVSLYENSKEAIISPAYTVFRVKNKKVLKEFLFMWMKRTEFDRMCWFMSDSSVRASLEWERFLEILIPIPDIETQKSVVAIHHVLEERKRINSKLNNLIAPISPILIKGAEDEMADYL